MKKNKGFISTSIIYSFFLVFILFMIAILMSFVNKAFLKERLSKNINDPGDNKISFFECTTDDLLSICLFKSEWREIDKIFKKLYTWCDENNIPRSVPKGEINNCTIPKAFAAGAITSEEKYFYDKQIAIYASAKNDEGDKIAAIKKNLPSLANGTYKEAGETKEAGMFKTSDYNGGTTYYYRGAEEDNYVLFAGKLWNVVRINGDNSIRLIYQGEWDKIKNQADKKTYIKNNGVIDANFSGGIDSNDARHFNVNKIGEFNKAKYEWAAKMHGKNINLWCDDSYEYKSKALLYINSSFCSWSKTKQKEELEKILNYGNTNYQGATSLWNIGYMNHGKSTVSNDAKFSNDNPSTIKSIIDGWINASFTDKEKADYMSSDNKFCAAKDIGLTYTSYSLVNDNTYVPGAYCFTDNIGRVIYSKKNIIASNGANWTFAQTIDLPTLDVNVPENCKNLGYNDGFAFEFATMTSAKITQSFATLSYCANESLMPVGSYGGLITSVELLEAGAIFRSANTSIYLASNLPYWTGDFAFGENADWEWNEYDAYYLVYQGEYLSVKDDEEKNGVAYIKPVINLKASVKYVSGIGTIDDPYIIGV